jgi:hypothetical protein
LFDVSKNGIDLGNKIRELLEWDVEGELARISSAWRNSRACWQVKGGNSMKESVTIQLTADDLQLVINAVEILSPDDPDAQERVHALYCKLLAVGTQQER